MVQINADKEEAEAVRVKVEAEEAIAKEKVILHACIAVESSHACILRTLQDVHTSVIIPDFYDANHGPFCHR